MKGRLARRIGGWFAHPRRALGNGHGQSIDAFGFGLFLIVVTVAVTGLVVGWLAAVFFTLP